MAASSTTNYDAARTREVSLAKEREIFAKGYAAAEATMAQAEVHSATEVARVVALLQRDEPLSQLTEEGVLEYMKGSPLCQQPHSQGAIFRNLYFEIFQIAQSQRKLLERVQVMAQQDGWQAKYEEKEMLEKQNKQLIIDLSKELRELHEKSRLELEQVEMKAQVDALTQKLHNEELEKTLEHEKAERNKVRSLLADSTRDNDKLTAMRELYEGATRQNEQLRSDYDILRNAYEEAKGGRAPALPPPMSAGGGGGGGGGSTADMELKMALAREELLKASALFKDQIREKDDAIRALKVELSFLKEESKNRFEHMGGVAEHIKAQRELEHDELVYLRRKVQELDREKAQMSHDISMRDQALGQLRARTGWAMDPVDYTLRQVDGGVGAGAMFGSTAMFSSQSSAMRSTGGYVPTPKPTPSSPRTGSFRAVDDTTAMIRKARELEAAVGNARKTVY